MQDDEAKRLFIGEKYPYYAQKWGAKHSDLNNAA